MKYNFIIFLVTCCLQITVSSQELIIQEIARKGFSDFDNRSCAKILKLKLTNNGVELMNSSEHFVDKIDSLQYIVKAQGGRSIWYRFKAEQDRELNFSLRPLAEDKTIFFVLYKEKTLISCPTADDLTISRAVLNERVDPSKGVGLTGESTSDYSNPEELPNILHFTPYHKSVFIKKDEIYFLNVLTSVDDIKHILQIGNVSIQIEQSPVSASTGKENLKSFLYGKAPSSDQVKVPISNLTSEKVVKPTSNYDHSLYDPNKAEKQNKETVPSFNQGVAVTQDHFEPASIEPEAIVDPISKTSAKDPIKNKEVPYTSVPNLLKGILTNAEQKPVPNTTIYVADVSMKSKDTYLSVKTKADGSFEMPITSNYIFISVDAHQVSDLANSSLTVKGQVPEKYLETKIYGTSINPDGSFTINQVNLAAYGSSELVSAPAGSETKSSSDQQATAKNTQAFTYKVQVGAFANVRNFKKSLYQKYGVLSSYKLTDGLTRFTVGSFNSLEGAEKLKQQMISDGIEGAFIVAFHQGTRTEFR